MKSYSIKFIPCLFLILSVLFGFVGCDPNERQTSEINVKEIAEAVKPLLDHPETLIAYDTDQIHFYLDLPMRYCKACTVMAQSRADSADEFGIFLCSNTDEAKSLEERLGHYLSRTVPDKLSYLNNCLNPPSPNADNSSPSSLIGNVRREGNAVYYTILSHDNEAIQNKVKALLNE